MPVGWQAKITDLFYNETGESYSDTTFRMLAIPEWYGNRLLIDEEKYPNPDALLGVIWSKPLHNNRIRIVSLVLSEEVQGKNYGSDILNEIMTEAKTEGKHALQLEVRKSNIKAQRFYHKHGLEIYGTIENYYSNEDGYVMEIEF